MFAVQLQVRNQGRSMADHTAKGSKSGWFDSDAFYAALDGVRRARDLNWKEVAAQSGVSASTLTRMAQGKRPDVDGLAALCRVVGTRCG